jgi:hypothetical protein
MSGVTGKWWWNCAAGKCKLFLISAEDMKVTLIYLLVLITISGCTVAQSNEHSANSSTSTPTALITTLPTPSSTQVPPPSVAEKLANRTSTRLELSQMKKMKLDQQPPTISKVLLSYEDTKIKSKGLAAYAEKTEIYVSERDLNHDGVAENCL